MSENNLRLLENIDDLMNEIDETIENIDKSHVSFIRTKFECMSKIVYKISDNDIILKFKKNQDLFNQIVDLLEIALARMTFVNKFVTCDKLRTVQKLLIEIIHTNRLVID